MNQSEMHDREVELNHKYYLMNKSLELDLKTLRDPSKFFHYMLKGLVVADHDINGDDAPTELKTPADTMEYMFQQLTEYKELYIKQERIKKYGSPEEPSAQDIMNRIKAMKSK